MADKFITASTLPLYWNVLSNWNNSTFPTSADIVYASGKTITINTNITANTITTAAGVGISSGGTFSVSGGSYSLNTNISAGTTPCLTISALTTNSQTVTIIGNTIGGSIANAHGINKTNFGTLNVIGNITGGTNATAYGLFNNTNQGSVNITGNSIVTSVGGSINNNNQANFNILGNILCYGSAHGFNNASTATLTFNGNVYNYSSTSAFYGILNGSTGRVDMSGSVFTHGNSGATATHGVVNQGSSPSIFNMVGDVWGGVNVTYGAVNSNSGTLSITGNVYSNGSVSIINSSTGILNLRSDNGILQSTPNTGTYNTSPLIYNSSTGRVNIIGNISGSTLSSPNRGIVVLNFSSGILNITGDVITRDVGIGTTSTFLPGLVTNASTGTINIFGNIYGGSKANTIGVSLISANGILNVSGNCYGGSSFDLSPAIYTSVATGSINITGNCIAGSAYPAIHAAATGVFVNVVNGSMIYTNGIVPIYAINQTRINVRPISGTPLQSIVMTDTNNNSRYFLTTFTANTAPLSGNVRSNLIYSGFSPTTQYTGSCIVPPYSAVTLNVPVDNGYGIASGLTITNLTSMISSYIL